MELYMSNTVFHHYIMVDILLLLPAKSLARFRYVSKSWYKLITDPSFINLHLIRFRKAGKLFIMDLQSNFFTLENFPESNQVIHIKKSILRDRDQFLANDIWGSCNGLIWIQFFRIDGGVSPFYIWNPTTMEYKVIPPMRKHSSSNCNIERSTYGFGYNLDDYEVLRLTAFGDRNPYSCSSAVDVYSLRKNSWRRLADIPYDISGMTKFLVPCNGAFHWITRPTDRTSRYSLIAYDPRNEKCIEIPLPDFILNYFSVVFEFKGKLCVQHESNLWMMREYGVRSSWIRLLNLENESTKHVKMFYPLCSTESDYIVIKCYDGTIALYEPEKKIVCKTEIRYEACKAVYCADSIVAVNISL